MDLATERETVSWSEVLVLAKALVGLVFRGGLLFPRVLVAIDRDPSGSHLPPKAWRVAPFSGHTTKLESSFIVTLIRVHEKASTGSDDPDLALG